MAQKYRKVDPRIWDDEKFEGLSIPDKLIALYVLTGPQTNRIGLFRLSPSLAAEHLGTSGVTFRERFGNVCRTLNWQFDEARKVVFLPNWWKYNRPDNPNVLEAVLADVHDVAQTYLLKAFAENTKHLDGGFKERFLNVMGNVGGNLGGNQEQEQEQEQDTGDGNGNGGGTGKPIEGVWGNGRIRLDTNRREWDGITDDDREQWSKAYPAVDLTPTLAQALAWCMTNPQQGRKSNYGRFLTNWLQRTQDRGGNRTGGNRGGPAGQAAAQTHRDQRRAAECPEPDLLSGVRITRGLGSGGGEASGNQAAGLGGGPAEGVGNPQAA